MIVSKIHDFTKTYFQRKWHHFLLKLFLYLVKPSHFFFAKSLHIIVLPSNLNGATRPRASYIKLRVDSRPLLADDLVIV